MYQIFAASSSPSLLSALGIDWRLLLLQAAAFVVLLAILGKFVYPPLIRSIDQRRATIEASLAEAKKTQDESAATEAKIAALIAEARAEADAIIARSHEEATSLLSEADAKAKTRSDAYLKDAHTQLDADIAKARLALKHDTMQLVALATEKIIDEKIDVNKDAKLIERSLTHPESKHAS
jgi:F-type H+-transporting ATPase subunit b